jgi:spermidine synthase
LAVIWTKSTQEARFEVRRAGNSVRLYRNGVFHSQFNARNPISANPWSLFLLPAYFRPADTIRRVLVLGVGGGAVIRLLRQCFQPERLIGVELDPIHISIARRFFGVTPRVAELVHADAADWLRGYKGPKFDLILDDLFGELDGDPVRAVESNRSWLSTLSKHLSTDGVLMMNFVCSSDLRDSASILSRLKRRPLETAFRLGLPDYENVIGAFMNQKLATKPLRQMLRASDTPCAAALAKIPYRIRRVSH